MTDVSIFGSHFHVMRVELHNASTQALMSKPVSNRRVVKLHANMPAKADEAPHQQEMLDRAFLILATAAFEEWNSVEDKKAFCNL